MCFFLKSSPLLLFLAAASVAGAAPDFARDIRPVLSDNCFQCHGPDEKTRKGELRLDLESGLFQPAESGRVAVQRNRPDESELIRRILTKDPDDVMPPPDSHKTLTSAQTALLREWIADGAPWKGHWAFTPVTRPPVPENAEGSAAIDAFLQARLREEGLTFSPEAARETLIRRATLDLTGLPPSPREVAEFVADPAPDAWEKLIDRLLASPHYGERMAQDWLDGARYADSHGYQADNERFMWRWRDWVIDAFNRNQPFDEFTVEQLAGDLLPDPTTDQRLATGFHRNNRINGEGGGIPEEWRTEYVIDRVETTGAVWLGLTMNCVRCHDHKYDPITQKEFYRFFAFFNNVPEAGLAEGATNHAPVMKAPRPSDTARLAELHAGVSTAEAALKAAEVDLAGQAAWEAELRTQVSPWNAMTLVSATAASGAELVPQPDGSLLVQGTDPAQDTYTITVKCGPEKVGSIRLEALATGPAGGPGRAPNGNFILTKFSAGTAGKPLRFSKASASFQQDGYPVESALTGKNPGWAIGQRYHQDHSAVFTLKNPAAVQPDGELVLRMEHQSGIAHHTLARFRLTSSPSAGAADAFPEALRPVLALAPEQRTPEQAAALQAHYRTVLPEALALSEARKARDDFEAALPTAMVMEEMPKPREAFLLLRGQYDTPDKSEVLTPGTPAALPPMPADAPRNRLGLARWIVSPDNPLTARVQVNRMWERFFGYGIVKTSENMGVQAEPPTHPLLLDWLASEFVRLGWDMKALQRTILLSRAYRQDSRVDAALHERDPENRLLARGPRLRLTAEAIRDQALSVSGLLVDDIGGPSVRPYMPDGVWDETSVYGNLRNYKHDTGPGLHRRTLYTIWKRTAAPPVQTMFDAPSREVCTVKRPRTNTPLQALALLNEVTFVEAARKFAGRMIREGGLTPEARLAWGFRLLTARRAEPAELAAMTAGYQRRLAVFQEHPDKATQLLATGDAPADPALDPVELAAFTLSANILLNLDEAVTRP